MGDNSLSQAVKIKSLMTKAMRREQYELVLFLMGALLSSQQSRDVQDMVRLEEEELTAMMLQATGHDIKYFIDMIEELSK